MTESVTVKVGNVPVRIYRMRDGRWRFVYHHAGKVVKRTFKALDVAKERARDVARALHNGSIDFGSMGQEQLEVCREVLRLGWTMADVLRLQSELAARALASMSVKDAVQQFLMIKQENQGRSIRYVDGLRRDLGALARDMGRERMDAVRVPQIEAWMRLRGYDGRRFNNVRTELITFWRWARKRAIITEGITAPEKMERRKMGAKTITTWSPAELRVMFAHVTPAYLPWLAIAAFAGVRTEELMPPTRSAKRPLMWEDVDMDRKLIILPPETSKTSKRRIIPMCDALVACLEPLRRAGRIMPIIAHPGVRETARLSAALGVPWRQNALRHSFGSYRAAIVQNLGQVSLEMGNSIAMCQQAYHEAKTPAEAQAWFSVAPNLPTFADTGTVL